MNRHTSLACAALVAMSGLSGPASAVTSAVPTAGIAVTSFVVGAAAATESALEETRSKWNRKLLGFGSILLMGIDPDPATYLSGTSVISFPDTLLSFKQLTWYGPFSDGSTGDTGPLAGAGAVANSGFFDQAMLFVPQAASPALQVVTTVNAGLLTVSWSAVPGIQAAGSSVNIFGAVFESISVPDLQLAMTPPGSPLANMAQQVAAQSLFCIPAGELVARGCGYPNMPIGFSVSAVPEPVTSALWLAGLMALAGAVQRSRRTARTQLLPVPLSVDPGGRISRGTASGPGPRPVPPMAWRVCPIPARPDCWHCPAAPGPGCPAGCRPGGTC